MGTLRKSYSIQIDNPTSRFRLPNYSFKLYHRGMPRELHVHFLPEHVDPLRLAGSTAVVIDVLRASTTIVHALAAGARAVVPAGDVVAARSIAARFPSSRTPFDRALLGGERNGVLIEGFDLDNSPLSYTPQAVAGAAIVFTTTNGTRALERCRAADRVLIGAFVNLNATVTELAADARPIHLICAGTDGKVSAEDVICAGAIAVGLSVAVPDITLAGAAARQSVDAFGDCAGSLQAFYEAVCASPGGRNLLELGFEADVRRSIEWDRFEIVPEYDRAAGEIRAAPRTDSIAALSGKTWVPAPSLDATADKLSSTRN
jgi:2-phosphosulfolactate phosphatase